MFMEAHRAQLSFSVQILLGLGHIFEGWADNCLAHASHLYGIFFLNPFTFNLYVFIIKMDSCKSLKLGLVSCLFWQYLFSSSFMEVLLTKIMYI